MSDRFLEQRTNLIFWVNLGNNASDTCTVLSEAFGGEAMKKSSVFKWNKCFEEGRENVEDDERSGCPRFHRTNKNAEKAQNLVHSDSQPTLLCGNTENVRWSRV
jgi:hypothetical protein